MIAPYLIAAVVTAGVCTAITLMPVDREARGVLVPADDSSTRQVQWQFIVVEPQPDRDDIREQTIERLARERLAKGN